MTGMRPPLPCQGSIQPGRENGSIQGEKMPQRRVAYILLWFPEPSQTFVLNEVNTLSRLGLDLKVYTLYGPRPADGRVAHLAPAAVPVERLGLAATGTLLKDLVQLRRRWGPQAAGFLARVLVRRWRTLETGGEAFWSALAGVHLARLLVADQITHIHAPWADGPATAAWVASKLTGIPFSFSARAGDVFPPDGSLTEKIGAATFIRTNNRANTSYLAGLAPGAAGKVHLVYNGVSLKECPAAPAPMRPPIQLLALGRFARTKGYDVLLAAAQRLKAAGFEFHLTLAGAGMRGPQLKYLTWKLGLRSRVSFPGFIPYDRVSARFSRADVFVMPSVVHASSDQDGIPNVIMEALLHRLPVVASDVAGINEVIRDRDTGLLVPQKDPAALAEAITALAGDRQAALAMAARGREQVLRQFDTEANHRQLLALFQNPAVHLAPASFRTGS
jgi:colanic acid/amylovoran biosynthesis glycosyltransferase